MTFPATTRRPQRLIALGCRLQPSSIRDAWYAANCPPSFDPRDHGVSQSDWLRWRVACWLRNAKPNH